MDFFSGFPHDGSVTDVHWWQFKPSPVLFFDIELEILTLVLGETKSENSYITCSCKNNE